jgi:hypothetical protein
MTEHLPFGTSSLPQPGGYFGQTYTYTTGVPGKSPEMVKPDQATCWDIPGWNTAFTVREMLKKPDLNGWTCQNPGDKNVMMDADGKLYINGSAILTPRFTSAPVWAVEVTSYQTTKEGPVRLGLFLGKYVSSYIPRCDLITDGGNDEFYIPVGKIFESSTLGGNDKAYLW